MRMPVCFLMFLAVVFFLAAPTRGDETGAPDGSALYAKHCSACHQGLDKTVLTGRSLSRIRSAIRHFAVMSKLRTLEEAELAAIAAALVEPQAAALVEPQAAALVEPQAAALVEPQAAGK